MRCPITFLAVSASLFFMAGAAAAQEVEVLPESQLNHLDCYISPETQAMVCPDVLTGRAASDSAPEPATAAGAEPSGEAPKGSPEWNAYCAGKYKSFDAGTGLYKSYSGQMRPCR